MRLALALIVLTSNALWAAEAPTESDYKQALLQEQAMRGGVIQEMGRLMQENAQLKQQVSALSAELEKLKAKDDSKEKPK